MFTSSFYVQLAIWVVVVGGVFGLLWKYGYLARFAGYVGDTREELKKCSWPTRQELFDTTLLVLVTTAILGVLLLFVDFVVLRIIRALIQ